MKSLRTLLLVALVPALPQALLAQDVEYVTASKLHLPGALGKTVNVLAKLGGGSSELVQTTRIKDDKMRTDDQHSSTIFNLSAKRYTVLDHKAKTFSEMSTEELRAQLQQMAAQSEAAPKTSSKSSAPDYKVAVDVTKEREEIAGANAQRSFLTVTAVMRDSTGKKVGDFVVLTDTWASSETPVAKAHAKFAKEAVRALGGGRNMSAALAGYPGAGEALQKAAEEAARIEGFPLRTTMHLIIVPDGVKYDRAQALAEAEGKKAEAEDGKKKGGVFGKLKAAAAAAAAPSKSEEASEEQQSEEPRQVTLLRISSEVRSIKTDAVPADAFAVPANYKKQTPQSTK